MKKDNITLRIANVLLIGTIIVLLLGVEWITVRTITAVYYKRWAAPASRNIKEYKKRLIQSIKFDPLYGAPRVLLSDVYTKEGEYEKARAELVKASKLTNIGGGGYKKLGDLYLHLGQPENARAFFEKALVLIPDDPETLEYLSYIEIRMKNYNRALQYLERATREDPVRPNSYYQVGQIFEKVYRDYVRAIRYYKSAIQSSFTYSKGLFFDKKILIDHIKKLATDKGSVSQIKQ